MAGWILYACRTPYAVELAETIWRRAEEVALLVDNLPPADGEAVVAEEPAAGIGAAVATPAQLGAEHRDLPTAIPLITPGHRFAVEAEARQRGLTSFPPLVDPTATIARTAGLGEGTVVNAAAIVAGGARVGRFVHLNRGASVGHHGAIEDYATLGPGCVLAGHVRVGCGAFLGTGAVCAPKVTVGANAVVGAGAVVIADVPAGAVAVGNPARVTREGCRGYGEVSVPAGR